MKKTGIIGHFGGNENFADGQTVKTKTLYNALRNTGKYRLYIVDTYYNRTNKAKLFLKTLICLATCDNIIILLSDNGRKVYFPLLYYLNFVFRRNIYHDIIGGNLAELIPQHKNWLKYLNSFKVNWIELNSVKKKLDALGLENVEVLPNFKEIKAIDKSEINVSDNGVLRLCTFSRVMKEKGIEDAIEAAVKLNADGKKCTLSIFGQIDPGYIKRFDELSAKFPEYIKYGGIVDFNKSVEVLSKFDLLLFPTHYYTEGVPGTLLDSFASGLPVVAPDIPAVKEMITNNKTGILYSFNDKGQLLKSIGGLFNEPDKIYNMKCACIDEYEKYRPEKIMSLVVKQLD